MMARYCVSNLHLECGAKSRFDWRF